MSKIPDKIQAWQMVEPGKLEKRELPVPELGPGEALVEIAGCGVCHTDLSYFAHGVKTVSPLPLTLGHEISGVVVAGEKSLVGKEVVVPAVMPCNNCPICAAGRQNRCLGQKMPGNSAGTWGGFATHIPVPSHDLCVIEDRGAMPLAHLAVVADAVTSPYQAAKRADVKPGDRVVVIGATGGTGTYMTQVCAALGADVVIAMGRNDAKLERIKKYGATHVINIKDKAPRDIKSELKEYCKANKIPDGWGWKIFEFTGTLEGQKIGLELTSFVSKLVISGFGTEVAPYMLSRLMAFDAEIIGTWACLPKYYPEAVALVLSRKIDIEPFVETRPMSQIAEVFQLADQGKLDKRVVLVPDF